MPDFRRRAPRAWLFAVVLLLTALPVGAQDISFYWESWNSNINVSAAEGQLTIAEAQTLIIETGTIGRVNRGWLDPVEVQTVYVNAPDGELIELRRANSGEAPGTYMVTTSGDETNLTAYMPERYGNGDSFLLQINYTAPIFTDNLIDWYAVPEERGAPVNSATVRFNFLDGTPPAEGLARVVSNNATLTISGRVVSVSTTQPLPDGEALYVQMPFGAEVGGATNNQNAPVAVATAVRVTPTPTASQPAALGISLESLLPIIVIGAIVIFLIMRSRGGATSGGGGGCLGNLGGCGSIIGVLMSLFGGRGGSGGGGIFPGGGGSSGGSGRSAPPTFGGSGGSSSGGGGFRRSGNQQRSVPTVRNRKGGGSAGVG